ncbi:MAG: substrate-binding domain-containing protein, partial [Pseudomonadota bacterium]
MAAASLAALVIGLNPAGSNAQTVVLKNKDGLFEFEGRLLSSEDGLYRLDTSVGAVNIPIDQVDCIGAACPENQAPEIVTPAPTANLAIANTAITVDSQSAFALASAAAEVAGIPVAGTNQQGLELARATRGVGPDAVFSTNLLTDTRLNQQNRAVVAYDALIVVTAPDVSVQEMSTDNLAAILSGSITRWSQLGGQDIP